MSRTVIVYSLVLGLGILGLCAGLSSWERSAHAANGLPDCQDGIDNDKDGLVDYPADPGCTSADDVSELDSASSDLGENRFDLSLADLNPLPRIGRRIGRRHDRWSRPGQRLFAGRRLDDHHERPPLLRPPARGLERLRHRQRWHPHGPHRHRAVRRAGSRADSSARGLSCPLLRRL